MDRKGEKGGIRWGGIGRLWYFFYVSSKSFSSSSNLFNSSPLYIPIVGQHSRANGKGCKRKRRG